MSPKDVGGMVNSVDTTLMRQFWVYTIPQTYLSKNTVLWLYWTYRKFPKYSDTQKICCNHS